MTLNPEQPKRILDAIEKEHAPVKETPGTGLDVHVSGIEDKRPSMLTHIAETDNVTEQFDKWYGRLRNAVFSHGFDGGYVNMNAFEHDMEIAFTEVCSDIDRIYGADRKAEGVRVKKDVLQAFMREMKDMYERDKSDIRIALAKGYAETEAQKYMPEEYFYVDDRERKIEGRAVSERAKKILGDFTALVRDIPEGLQPGELGVSETELDARAKDFLNEKMSEENKGVMSEVVLSVKQKLKNMDETQDPDGRWRLVAMAIDAWCDVYFPDMHFVEDNEEDDEEDDNWWRKE
jgi:hypothetical protein